MEDSLATKTGISEIRFLEINNNQKSDLGDYSYVLDTKNSRKVKGVSVYQLGICDLLKNIQGIFYQKFYFVLKDKKKQKIKVSDVYDIYLYHKVSYEKFLSKNLGKTFPRKCSFCNFCDWQTHCNNEWEDKRHKPIIR